MLVKDIMHTGLHLVGSDMSVKDASKIMAKLNIGAILIGRPDELEGIFSERDLMKKVVTPGISVENTLLKDVMTRKILTVKETEPEEVLTKMEKKRIRHLPVVNEAGICVGMLGIRDLMESMLNKLESENKTLVDYLLAVSRVAMVIMDLGHDKWKEEGEQFVINHKLSKSEFESLSDTSKETLNKVLEILQNEGLINVSKNKIEILDKTKFLKKII